jgi:hypothetical protein
MTKEAQALQICHMCRGIRVGTGMSERWVARDAYLHSADFDPMALIRLWNSLTHSYCPNCVNYIAEYREAA